MCSSLFSLHTCVQKIPLVNVVFCLKTCVFISIAIKRLRIQNIFKATNAFMFFILFYILLICLHVFCDSTMKTLLWYNFTQFRKVLMVLSIDQRSILLCRFVRFMYCLFCYNTNIIFIIWIWILYKRISASAYTVFHFSK